VADGSRHPARRHTDIVPPTSRLRLAAKLMTDPMESLAQSIAERVLDLVIQALDINALIGRIDMNALLDQVDVNQLLNKVDLNEILEHVDLNQLLKQVDVNQLVERVDLNQILEHVDLNQLLKQVDINQLLNRVDVDSLVEQTDLGAVIAGASGGLATDALDEVRSQAVGADQFIDRWVARLLRRKNAAPLGPPGLLDAEASP
jgi:hypothetical protein